MLGAAQSGQTDQDELSDRSFDYHGYFIPSVQNEPQDLLFVLTARYRVCILGYTQDTGDVVTRASGDVQVCEGSSYSAFVYKV